MKTSGSSVSRRWVLAASLAGMADAALADPLARSVIPPLRPGLPGVVAVPPAGALIEKARLGGQIGYMVADAVSGTVLEALNPTLPLLPASTAKALTTLYALDTLGPDYRFATHLIATGPLQNGRLEGDLILQGGGDPVLDTDGLAELAAALKAAGLREITGSFRYDASALPTLAAIDPGQPDHVGYNPAISGLNLNFNRVYFEWRRGTSGWDVTMEARTERQRPPVGMARMRVVDRDWPLYTYDTAQGRDDWTVAASALGQGGGRWLPVRQPALYVADVFRTLARAQGIELGPASATGISQQSTVLARIESIPLSQILRGMLKYSNNLTAEAIGLTATAMRHGRVDTLAGSAAWMNAWLAQGLGGEQAGFVDHSGLGPLSRISARCMVRALGQHSGLRDLLKDIPMRDARGRPVPGHPVSVRAKTGTLNFASALAGFATAASGRELIFSIQIADQPRRDALGLAEMEKPAGGHEWAVRARNLQLALIERWAGLYAT